MTDRPHRLRFLSFAALCLALLLVLPLPAQSTWTLVSPTSGSLPPTTATLWGACYGRGQFVAVGENGTILTSPDGLTWTLRPSGTTAWLTSVAYGFNHYLAVGADRTVLSSPDAVTWTPFTDFATHIPRERLNVVGFDHDRFLAYGEHDFGLSLQLPLRPLGVISSHELPPGVWWRALATGTGRTVIAGESGLAVLSQNLETFLSSRIPTTVPPGTHPLSGLVFDHDTFTAVGDNGTILTSPDATTWTAQPSGTTAHLQAIVSFNNTLVAVGTSGTVLTQNETGLWSPARTTTTTELLLALAASDTAAIAVGARGTILRATPTPAAPAVASSPASVTAPLGGAASFVVRARGSLPLSYQWSRNGLVLPGETHSTLIRTPLTGADASTYAVTLTNSVGSATSSGATLTLLPAPPPLVDPTFQADASLEGYASALHPLPDGSVLVGFGPNPLVKLTATGALDPAWTPAHATVRAVQPDGRILVGGIYPTTGSASPRPLVRLLSDGMIDPSFTAAPEAETLSPAFVSLQPDGKILLATAALRFVRLRSDGRLDATFQAAPLPPLAPLPGYEPRPWTTRSIAVADDGKILVASDVSLSVTSFSRPAAGSIIRLLPDGSPDPSFREVRLDASIDQLRILDDGGALILSRVVASSSGPFYLDTLRIRRDGTAFPGYVPLRSDTLRVLFIYPDGRLLGQHSTESSPVRYTALGALDPTFTGGIGTPTFLAATTGDRIFAAGNFTLYDGVPCHGVARLNPVSPATSSLTAPQLLAFSADKSIAATGEPVTFRAAVTGSGPLTYDWSVGYGFSNPTVTRTTSPVFTHTFAPPPFFYEPYSGDSPWVQLTVRNARGETTGPRLDFTLLPLSPSITAQPTRVSTQTGRSLLLPVTLTAGTGQLAYAWRRNGELLAPGGPSNPQVTSLEFLSVVPSDAGTYTLTLTNALGATTTSNPIVLTVDDSSRFTNLSTRAFVGSGDRTAIAGFVITGNRPRTVLVRGIGPGLEPFGVTGTLADPQLTLFDASGTRLDANDDWSARSSSAEFYDTYTKQFVAQFQSLGAFPLTPPSKDAALSLRLDPGTYTVELSAPPGQSGTALLELYEGDNDAARILNLSTRALVTPAAPAFAGFAIRGSVAKTVLVRAAGPTLATFGLATPLTHPRLTVRDATGSTVATNSAWETAPDRAALLRATSAVGAFAFAPGSADAALLLTLPPGNYTAVIESADTSGLVLAEIYELPAP